ncbi:MAG TPA: sulfite oxidase-like oxidoreductase [Anaerolineales bacterium]|nr:sulfite oxidase-like oxidoreductase [Anaerolineales bacterium]
MSDRFVSRGFTGKRRQKPEAVERVPPGQYLTDDFPVLSAGPTPRTALYQWTFTIEGAGGESIHWSWQEFLQLPAQSYLVDIHCVTKWTKLDTRWEGVSIDTLLEQIDLDPRAVYVTAFCDGGYTTNMPLPDVLNGRAFVAYRYAGQPLAPEHGGPARLVVPHLYFWKSAKWVRGLRLMEKDKPGFWESLGYNNRGDPWKEQRYWGD